MVQDYFNNIPTSIVNSLFYKYFCHKNFTTVISMIALSLMITITISEQ